MFFVWFSLFVMFVCLIVVVCLWFSCVVLFLLFVGYLLRPCLVDWPYCVVWFAGYVFLF